LNPKDAWGGLMRNIDQTDFETGNIEFIEFWLQDPFVSKPAAQVVIYIFSWEIFQKIF
jgi:cell surface protein SprA